MANIKITETKDIDLAEGDLVSLQIVLVCYQGRLKPCLKKWETIGDTISDILFTDEQNTDIKIINK